MFEELSKSLSVLLKTILAIGIVILLLVVAFAKWIDFRKPLSNMNLL